MTFHEDIEINYLKRKKEAEERAFKILYGTSPSPEFINLKPQVISQDDKLKTEEGQVAKPLEFEKHGRKVFRYVGEPDPEVIPFVPEIGPIKPKWLSKDERQRFIVIAKEAGLTTMNIDGTIQKPNGTKITGIFKRA